MSRRSLPRWARPLILLGALLCSGAALALPSQAAQRPADTCTVHSGRQMLDVPYDGRVYHELAYLPAHPRHGLPLVLNLHGSTHDGENQERLTQIEPVADREGFAVLAPNGGIRDGEGYSWNVPGVPLASGHYPPPDARDDVDFLAATVHAAESRYCVDGHRVYATGHSGGARMVSALACDRADLFAAVAPVSGLRAGPADPDEPSRPLGTCLPSRPVAVASFHGTADPLNPYEGGGGPYWGYSVPTAVRAWEHLDGCARHTYSSKLNRHASVHSTVYCAGGVSVRSYVIGGAGHIWPGSPYNDPDVPRNYEIRATSTIWSFFARYRRG